MPSQTYYVHTCPVEYWHLVRTEVQSYSKDFGQVAEDFVMENFSHAAQDRDTVIVATQADGSDAREYHVEVRRGDSWTELLDGSGAPVQVPAAPTT